MAGRLDLPQGEGGRLGTGQPQAGLLVVAQRLDREGWETADKAALQAIVRYSSGVEEPHVKATPPVFANPQAIGPLGPLTRRHSGPPGVGAEGT